MTPNQQTAIEELIDEWGEDYSPIDSVLADPMMAAFELGLRLGREEPL